MMIYKFKKVQMPYIRKVFLLLVASNLILACAQKKQYEILSPCVSLEALNHDVKNPCIRRPANRYLS